MTNLIGLIWWSASEYGGAMLFGRCWLESFPASRGEASRWMVGALFP